jgi:pyridoxine kinase
MGDNGQFYVPAESAPAYSDLLPVCDLILPNQFELEVLAKHPVSNVSEVITAIGRLHDSHNVKHVLVTSMEPSLAKQAFESGIISPSAQASSQATIASEGITDDSMLLIGSTRDSAKKSRTFALLIPRFPVSFTGTGDMFSALLTVYLRAMVTQAVISEDQPGWVSPDSVQAVDLPLAHAAELTVEVMQRVLRKTYDKYEHEMAALQKEEMPEKTRHVKMMKALELRVVRSVRDILDVEPGKCRFKAVELKS